MWDGFAHQKKQTGHLLVYGHTPSFWESDCQQSAHPTQNEANAGELGQVQSNLFHVKIMRSKENLIFQEQLKSAYNFPTFSSNVRSCTIDEASSTLKKEFMLSESTSTKPECIVHIYRSSSYAWMAKRGIFSVHIFSDWMDELIEFKTAPMDDAWWKP